MADRRVSNTPVMYLNAPTSRNGTSSACSIFRAITSTAVVANDDPIMRVAMITPAISSVFFRTDAVNDPRRAEHDDRVTDFPAVVAKPKARVPSCGVAKKVLKKVANCWSKTSYTQATPITYRMNIHILRWRNRLNTVLAVICRWFAPGRS